MEVVMTVNNYQQNQLLMSKVMMVEIIIQEEVEAILVEATQTLTHRQDTT